MKVSVLIPVYNVAPYIERCLQSVVDQTYTDIECILVDDCGSDNSIELAQNFINNYKGNIKFSILHHDKNKGQSAARNTALKYAKGEYVYFLDSDDAITSDCIEILMSLATKYPNAVFAQGNFLDRDLQISKYGWKAQLPEYCQKREKLEQYILFTVVTSAIKSLRSHFLLTVNYTSLRASSMKTCTGVSSLQNTPRLLHILTKAPISIISMMIAQ